VKLLLDTCVSGVARNFLKAAGHDVIWSAEWDNDPGDEEILQRAHREGRVLVTIDKDFGELAIVRELPHAGIVRLVGLRSGQQGPVCAEVLSRYGPELQKGAIVTAGLSRARIRPAG
jgi:predicted nuclease of predicted toxin-antitoxin system